MTTSYPLRGHLYWVRIPDEPGGKQRPALVLSPDARNRLANDVIVVPLTTNLRASPFHVRLAKGEAGCQNSSIIKAELVTTLPKRRLAPTPLGGPLSATRITEVEKAVLRAIGVPV